MQPYIIIWLRFYPRSDAMTDAATKALHLISAHGGAIRTRDALSSGIHPRTLYELRETGALEQVTRGVYRLADLPPVGDPDLALVAERIPKGVVCLISALALHDLTTQIPHEIHLALPRAARYPQWDEAPLAIFRFSAKSYAAGVVTHDVGGATVKAFDPEKSLADCFKFRNKIGMDVVLEAFNAYRARRGASLQKVLDYAKINRVENAIKARTRTASC
jgi:predicted transcriptional regulator of viral defense system